MRGGKEEESKAMGPMFPRLHVNDTSKGGPRAPPRNKMALYEQLSVPSQRFNSSSSASTRPQHKGGSSAPSNSSSQKGGGAQERPFFSPFNVPTHSSAHSPDKSNHELTDAPHSSPRGADPERRPIKLVRRDVLSSSKQSTAPDSSPRQTKEVSRKESCSKKPVEDDDFMVPTLFNQTTATEKVVLAQESGDKSAKLFRPLPRFSSENIDRNAKISEKGVGCSNSEAQKEGKEARDREELEALQDGFTEETMVGISISPDDVVSAIGHKTFWKARRLIVNQQRVFAVQVFELHRLIKVQKLIAASPDVLQSDILLGKKSPAPIKAVPAIGSNLIALSQGSKHADEPQLIKDVPECSKETTVVVVVENNNSNQEYIPSREEAPDNSQVRSSAAVNSAMPPTAPENKPTSSCCLPPAPNQWLVPVMSPSEGLVYKPYAGPYPPAGSFMSPLFPGCTPVPIPTANGDFMNSAYGLHMPMPVPVQPHPPQNMGVVGLPNYFQPFGMQVMNQNHGMIPNPAMLPNPIMSASAVEQVSHLVASKPDRPVHVEQHSRGSCNMAHMKSDAFSGMWGFRPSKDSEVQGSTASSPFERGDGLPFFQMGSASVDASLLKPFPSGGAGNTARAIKVVPHNPQLATESAARIFQSIQREREQNDT